jgi:hypothetical protein
LRSFFIALVFVLTIYPTAARAQMDGELEVNIPFQFHAGNAQLLAGMYRIHTLSDADLTVMEITSADGSTSAVFEVHQEDANFIPARGELISTSTEIATSLRRSLTAATNRERLDRIALRKNARSRDCGTAGTRAGPAPQQQEK